MGKARKINQSGWRCFGCGLWGISPDLQLRERIEGSFSLRQVNALRLHKWSSTLRETQNAEFCIKCIIETLREKIKGLRLLYIGDNEGCISDLQHMRGQGDIFKVVKQLYLYAKDWDVELDFQWVPRSDDELKVADAYSRESDPSEIFLCRKPFKELCTTFGCWPNLDVFAGSADGHHKCHAYYTRYYSPGTLGVDALSQSWSRLPSGRHASAWIFPPVWLIGETLNKILDDQVCAILVLPAVTRYWTPLLRKLPITKAQRLAYRPGLYYFGSRAPAGMLAWKMSFMAYKIDFSRHPK